jgi:hypothetical protein
MKWERQDISRQLNSFVNGPDFKNFEDIMEDLAQQKFIELQSSPDTLTHAELIAGRKVLNMYINLARDLKYRLKSIELDKISENQAKIEASQRVED